MTTMTVISLGLLIGLLIAWAAKGKE